MFAVDILILLIITQVIFQKLSYKMFMNFTNLPNLLSASVHNSFVGPLITLPGPIELTKDYALTFSSCHYFNVFSFQH